MSKFQRNATLLSASDAEIAAAVQRVYLASGHLRTGDPGHGESNVVFIYFDAFDEDREAVAESKAHYRRAGLGDLVVKQRLNAARRRIVGPIREHRAGLARDPGYITDVLGAGTSHAREVTVATQAEVHAGLGLFTWMWLPPLI